MIAEHLMRLHHLLVLAMAAIFMCVIASCEREPLLYLVDPGKPIDLGIRKIEVDINVLWDYEVFYDWQSEWYYGWDTRDDSIFGGWDIVEPNTFNLRRYYTEKDPSASHTSVLKDIVEGRKFKGFYEYGFYDLLAWNDVMTLDGVQSLHYDEETTLDYVTAYTNQAQQHTSVPHHAPAYSMPYKAGYAFYQPEFLFSGRYDDLNITDNPADYDSIDYVNNIWYKFVPLDLTPVTYIYLTQVIMHHNNGRISGIDGTGNLTGMARSVNLNTHITSDQDISVNYPMRMKNDIAYPNVETQTDESVDIVGGRVMTFGLTDTDPYQVTRASTSYLQIVESKIPNYLEVNMLFFNGRDSTFVFDVTDQVKEHFKGGVITVHLDVDNVPIPSVGGGSMFDAVVEDFEDETHEFDMN